MNTTTMFTRNSRYYMKVGDGIVSHYAANGPGGRKGQPVAYYWFEIELAAEVLTRLLGETVEPKHAFSDTSSAMRRAV